MGNHVVALELRAKVTSNLAFNDLDGLRYEEYLCHPEAIGVITARDLHRISRRYPALRKEVVAVVEPGTSPAGQQEGPTR